MRSSRKSPTSAHQVMIFAEQNADGALTARFISAGKDGIKPPM
jgi:hypothetical protein